MSCSTNTLAGIPISCDSQGGISAIYIAKTSDVISVTLGTDEEVTGITMASGVTFATYSFKKGNATYNTTGTRDDKAQTSFHTAEIAMTFNRLNKSVRKELEEIFISEVYVIVKLNSGEFLLVGYDSVVRGYAAATALNSQSGAEMNEANKYDLTLSAQTRKSPYHILNTVISGII